MNIYTAKAVFDSLPQPVRQGDYEKASAHFRGDEYWSAEVSNDDDVLHIGGVRIRKRRSGSFEHKGNYHWQR